MQALFCRRSNANGISFQGALPRIADFTGFFMMKPFDMQKPPELLLQIECTGMVKKLDPISCDPQSWLPLAAVANSRNLGPTFLTISVDLHRNELLGIAAAFAPFLPLCTCLLLLLLHLPSKLPVMSKKYEAVQGEDAECCTGN